MGKFQLLQGFPPELAAYSVLGACQVLIQGLVQALHRSLQLVPDKLRKALKVQRLGIDQDLAGVVPGQPVLQNVEECFPIRRQNLVGGQIAGGHVAKAQAKASLLVAHRAEEVVLGLVQHAVFQHRARGDNPDHVPLDNALGQFGVLQLLANGHLVALCHQLGDVALRAVEGHAAHGSPLLLAAVTAGERQLQLLGDGLGVVEEHLVKIAKAKEKYRVRILFFHLEILFHHWGVIRHGSFSQPFP